MRVLVLNAGSSTLKVRLVAVAAAAARPLESGLFREFAEVPQAWFAEAEAVGHRVVHGGDRFQAPVRIDDRVLGILDQLTEIAPLHNPHAVAVIREAHALRSSLPMVAVFDTAFHRTLPEFAASYAINAELAAKHRIRRYGFHGIAHASMLGAFARARNRPDQRATVITLQLGNGCSATAIKDGRSVDTSMGFTPLEGLMMGTRSGDIDPALVCYLARRETASLDLVEHWLNEESGLRGVSGLSNDVRVLLDSASPRAALALDMFCHRARKYLGAYLAVLGGAEAVIFGGGIGEHAPIIRARICEGFVWCGLTLDPARNRAAIKVAAGELAEISSERATLKAYVAGVDEETEIARATAQVVETRTSDASLG